MNSELPGFYRLSVAERRAAVAQQAGLNAEDTQRLAGDLGVDRAERMIENTIGVHELPLGVCVNLVVDGKDRLVPMSVEEPSVVAAACHAAKLLRAGGGVTTEVSPSHMIGQVQLVDLPDAAAAEAAIEAAREQLLDLANTCDPMLTGLGGGARTLEIRNLPPLGPEDPCGTMLVVHLIVDVLDAMGANAVNRMCETLAPELEALTGAKARLRILTNLADRRTVVATGRVPIELLPTNGTSAAVVAQGVMEASVFAERDAYRASTHNKGIMNGIDAVLLALGQDWRAVEAGAHSYAARGERYAPLSTWRVEGEYLVGCLEMPLAVGTVGGVVRVHPTVQAAMRLAGVQRAADLASIVASIGLAQNLGALRALADEGINRGHLRLHARNVAAAAGASLSEVETVAESIADRGQICLATARTALAELRCR